jgi:hypothetical protein
MNFDIISLRPFIGSKDFKTSRAFYADLGFTEFVIDKKMSVFRLGRFSFYLQDYYNEDWVNNTMLFIEVADVDACFERLKQLKLGEKYPDVRLVPIRRETWGAECFLHDPAGVLLHFGSFTSTA